MGRTLRVGTRTSPLALKQLEEVIGPLKKEFPELEVEVIGFKTAGDRDKATPLDRVEKEDFFTDEIDRALREGRIDCAVHSAKDLPEDLGGLTIAALTPSIDPDEVLVSRRNRKLAELPEGARVGTSSLRRKEQLRGYRPDLRIVDIRGNIGERLDQLDKGGLGACPSNDLWRATCHLQANQGVWPKSYPLRYFKAATTPSRAASGGCPKGFGGGRPSAALRTPRRSVKLRLRRHALHPVTRRSKRVESHCSERLLDGIVIAAAGLVRLGLEERITERIPSEIVRPHPRQGSLAVVIREKDRDLTELLCNLGRSNE